MLLSTNISDALFSLVEMTKQQWVDAVEIGPWAKLEQIVGFRSRLGNIPFTFHAGGMAAQVGWKKDWVVQMQNYLEITRSKWISIHLLPIPLAAETKMRQGATLQIPAGLALQVMKWQIHKIKNKMKVPVLLENIEPIGQFHWWCQAEWIRHICLKSRCDFLLDLGHARVAAEALEMDVQEYIIRLPLQKTRQIHVSGVRRNEGKLFDAHEPLEGEDYLLLEWVLERTQPEMVTLEYTRNREALGEQLIQLRAMFR